MSRCVMPRSVSMGRMRIRPLALSRRSIMSAGGRDISASVPKKRWAYCIKASDMHSSASCRSRASKMTEVPGCWSTRCTLGSAANKPRLRWSTVRKNSTSETSTGPEMSTRTTCLRSATRTKSAIARVGTTAPSASARPGSPVTARMRAGDA